MNLNKITNYLKFSAIVAHPLQIQLLLISMGCAFLWLLLVLSINSSLTTHNERNRIQITALTSKFNMLQKEANAAQDFLNQKKNNGNSFNLTNIQANNPTYLINQLVSLATQDKFELNSIKPSPQKQQNILAIQPVQLSAKAHYSQLFNFLSQLNQLPVVNIWHDFDLQVVPAETDSAEPLLQLDIILYFYFKL
jgi:Tfp pilus assembly protein PilO